MLLARNFRPTRNSKSCTRQFYFKFGAKLTDVHNFHAKRTLRLYDMSETFGLHVCKHWRLQQFHSLNWGKSRNNQATKTLHTMIMLRWPLSTHILDNFHAHNAVQAFLREFRDGIHSRQCTMSLANARTINIIEGYDTCDKQIQHYQWN